MKELKKKDLFKTSTKTIDEAGLFAIASDVVLNEIVGKLGFTFRDKDAIEQIHRIYKLLKEAAKV